MDDTTSRAAAILIAERYGCNNGSALGKHSGVADCIASEIAALQAVDAVPVVHGKWQWLSSTYDRMPCEMRYWCSRCKHETITHGREPWERFCPNCGARMDGELDG